MSGGGTATPASAANTPHMIRIKIDGLRIRNGPDTNYASKGYIKPGTYTIIEESIEQGATLWGRLKSGAEWIALSYTEKI